MYVLEAMIHHTDPQLSFSHTLLDNQNGFVTNGLSIDSIPTDLDKAD